jgi:hypothetical protein
MRSSPSHPRRSNKLEGVGGEVWSESLKEVFSKAPDALTAPVANSLEVMPRASSASCDLELMPMSECLLCSISFLPSPSLPPAKRLETFINSWHNSVRHRAACSSVNLTSPLILEAPFGKGGPCQAAIIRHPSVSIDRAHKVDAQSLPWPPSFVTLRLRVVIATLVPLAGTTV